MSTPFIEIHWTSGDVAEARRIGRLLVEQRLAACVQIVPLVESLFLWQGKLDEATEAKVVVKTRREFYDRIRKLIEENARYEVPEILFFSIDGGNEAYLKWMGEILELASEGR